MQADKIMYLDLETENHEYFGRFASPHHPLNYVVRTGYAVDDGEPYGDYYKSKEEASDWLHIPDDVWLIVAHNAGFELFWMLTQQREKVAEFIKRGGHIVCTQMAEYLLSGQTHQYAALDEIAPKYGGSTKIDAVKLLWEQGKLTSEIDPDLLGEYLLGTEGDIENTRHTFLGQYEQLVDRGMWDMFLVRCDSLLYNAVCESNGLKVNRATAFAEKERLEAEIDTILADFHSGQADFPEEVEFKMTRFQMSAYIYGGPIKYSKRVPRFDKQGNPIWKKYDAVTLEDGQIFDVSEWGRCKDSQQAMADDVDWVGEYGADAVRYKSGKNKGKVKLTREDSPDQDEVWDHNCLHICEGMVNLDELPTAFVEEFKRQYIGSQVLADGKTPVISTKEEAIKDLLTRPELSDRAKELLALLSKFQDMDKELGTFYLKQQFDDDGNVDKQGGMLQYLTDDDVIHHSLNSTATATTRLSSTKPNLQNTPSSSDSKVKDQFISHFGESGKIVSADYTNVEVIVLALLANDEALKDFVRSGKNMHTFNLANWVGVSYEEALAIVKDENHPLHVEYNRIRDELMKPMEFSANYGASPAGVAYASGGTIEQAEEFIKFKAEAFPEVARYHAHVAECVESNTKQHREMADDGSYRVYRTGVMKMPDGTEFTYRQYPSTVYTKQGPVEVMKFKDTQMKNYQTQGTAAFVIQETNSRLIRHLFSVDFYGGKCLPINTVHDEDVFDIHDDVLQEATDDIREIMEAVAPNMSYFGYDWDLPFPVGLSAGPTWKDQHPLSTYLEA